MTYNVLDICKYILAYYKKNNASLSNLKMQKILYFLQAEFLVSKDTPCFSDPIIAWGCGPVVIQAYNQYKIYGGTLIPNYNIEDDVSHLFYEEDKELIDGILEATFKYSSVQLTHITINQAPWKMFYIPNLDVTIPQGFIKNFFKD